MAAVDPKAVDPKVAAFVYELIERVESRVADAIGQTIRMIGPQLQPGATVGYGTVVDPGPPADVLLDVDGVVIPAQALAPVEAGQRVAIIYTPPAGALVLGAPLPPEPPPETIYVNADDLPDALRLLASLTEDAPVRLARLIVTDQLLSGAAVPTATMNVPTVYALNVPNGGALGAKRADPGFGNYELIRAGTDDSVEIGATDFAGQVTRIFGQIDQRNAAGIIDPIMTTAERDALTGVIDGMRIYNSDAPGPQIRKGGIWQNIPTSGAGTGDVLTPNGVDDTAALQAAFDSGASWRLAPGIFRTTSPLTYAQAAQVEGISPGQMITGAGIGRTIIRYTGNSFALILNNGVGSGGVHHKRFYGIQFECESPALGLVKMVDPASFSRFQDCAFLGYGTTTGIGVLGTGQVNCVCHNVFDHCFFRNLKYATVLSGESNGNHFRDCWFGVLNQAIRLAIATVGEGGTGTDTKAGADNRFTRCELNGTTALGIYIRDNAARNKFDQIIADGPTASLDWDTPTMNYFHDCHLTAPTISAQAKVVQMMFGLDEGDGQLGRSLRIGDEVEINHTKIINSGGNAGAPSYTFSGDTDTGLFWAGPNQVGIAIAGVEQLRVRDFGPGTTALHVGTNVAGVVTLRNVTYGANDSGGAGFRMLRIPN